MKVQSLGQEDPLERGMETNSCTVAWEIPGTEQPGGLHDLMTKQQQQQLYYLVKLINGKKIRAELKFYYIFTTTESVLEVLVQKLFFFGQMTFVLWFFKSTIAR